MRYKMQYNVFSPWKRVFSLQNNKTLAYWENGIELGCGFFSLESDKTHEFVYMGPHFGVVLFHCKMRKLAHFGENGIQ